MRTLSALLLSLTLATTPAMAQSDSGAPRTLLEAMDVSHPEATASAFVAAYSKSDYFAAAHLLTFDAKTGFQSAMMSREGVKLLFPRSPGTVGAAAVHTLDGPFMTEQTLDFAVFFDDVLYQAEITGVLPFKIRQDAEVTMTKSKAGAVATIDDGITLHLVQTRPGRWLVDRIELSPAGQGGRPW
ncbi:MAG: hypothetical protein P0Y65_14620 [Candidatus Devosia phytovorans]|uniref:DUF4440 domain-containing protein n=1 Tax=Candidatus Devosia phytovorans TaxID=3121372 RepID=A0AAJ5VSN1_9HYPH|nr:hypothetical protein [Devosia sp.]WEK03421.1 MAG: hypothetical protein P0Y65_14620 [Devosia sp.]